MKEKVDIWEQELRAWQEEAAALKTHSNESLEPGLAQRSASQYESSDHQPIRAVNAGLAVALKVKRKPPGPAGKPRNTDLAGLLPGRPRTSNPVTPSGHALEVEGRSCKL